MKKKAIVLSFILLTLAQCIGAEAAVTDNQAADASMQDYASSVLYKGSIVLLLDKDTYSPGDTVKAEITLQNMEKFPLLDASIIVNVVEGIEHMYPSDKSDDNNLIYEGVVGGLSLAPGQTKTIIFNYTIPQDLRKGDYLFEAYAETKRTPVVGIPFIFLSPESVSYKVDGGGDYPHAKILWNETVFNGKTGQKGAGVDAGSAIEGTVYVRNLLNSKTDYVLNVSTCVWDDILCDKDDLISSKQFPVTLGPNETFPVEVKIEAPAKPDAYAIRLELTKDGRTISLYRSRIIVYGATAKIRKMSLGRPLLKKGDSGEVMLLIGPSPDPYTLPVVRNAKVSYTISSGGNVIVSDSSIIPALSVKDAGLVPLFYNYTAPQDLTDYELCSRIESDTGELFDRYCMTVDRSKIPTSETLINVSWIYDNAAGALDLEMCATDLTGFPAKTNAAVLLLAPGGIVETTQDNIEVDGCKKTSLRAYPGVHTILVNDLNTNKQTKVDIDTTERTVTASKPAPSCGNGICEDGETQTECCTDCGCAQGSECVKGACLAQQPQASTETNPLPQAQQKTDDYPIYAGLALIALGALWFILKTRNKAK